MIAIKNNLGIFQVRNFTNVDPDETGVCVYDVDYNYMGEMVNEELPDLEDEEAIAAFETRLEEWLNENL